MIKTTPIDEPQSMRQAYAEELTLLGFERDDFIILDADTLGGTFIKLFAQTFPSRHITFGVAEQNMMSAAAGLSTTGIIPVVNTFGVFASMRSIEQYRSSICYPNFNVKAVISHQGIDVGPDGPTHQDIGDIAVVRSIPRTAMISPADRIEMRHMVRWMLDHKGPVYMRTGRSPLSLIHGTRFEDYDLQVGRWPVISEGKDVTLISVAAAMRTAIEAVQYLSKHGISAQLLNASWIKPVDEAYVVNQIAKTRGVITIEDHNVKGGIGTLVSEILSQHKPLPVERVGVEDTFAESGEWADLYQKYGLTKENVLKKAERVLNRAIKEESPSDMSTGTVHPRSSEHPYKLQDDSF
jgi:transketolase